jgi:hypothetical protein
VGLYVGGFKGCRSETPVLLAVFLADISQTMLDVGGIGPHKKTHSLVKFLR